MANDDAGKRGARGHRQLAGGTQYGGEAPMSTLTGERAQAEKKWGERKREATDDLYLGRSSGEVKLRRSRRVSGTDATTTSNEAEMGH